MTINQTKQPSQHVIDRLSELSLRDQCLVHIQTGLSTLWGNPIASRPLPPLATSTTCAEAEAALTPQDKKISGRLMRVNAVGEICAQGLYLGQAMTAKNPHIRTHLLHAAYDEINHLVWCHDRMKTLHTSPSKLNPLWFLYSVLLGMGMGLSGDGTSLGFVVETEQQVLAHLKKHLKKLPKNDKISRHILKHMYIDEESHASDALNAGGQPLPTCIKAGMRWAAKIITGVSYWI